MLITKSQICGTSSWEPMPKSNYFYLKKEGPKSVHVRKGTKRKNLTHDAENGTTVNFFRI